MNVEKDVTAVEERTEIAKGKIELTEATTNKLFLNDGIGVIELVLILVVLLGLILLFKNQLTTMINAVFTKVNTSMELL